MSGVMHMRSRSWMGPMVVLVGAAWASLGHAQGISDPDARTLSPVMMIVLDTSGSMEGIPGCTCPGNPDTNLCDECYPDCSMGEKNRWALAVEALTGPFDTFSCTQVERTTSGFTYDFGYFAPHHALPPPVTACTPPMGPECAGLLGPLGVGLNCLSTNVCEGGSDQQATGLLDAYRGMVRFGLLTFDTIPTYRDAGLVPDYGFNEVRSESVDGAFSYGGPRDLTYPNCPSTYRVDTGVRNESATEGRLISAGPSNATGATLDFINDQIQQSLLRIRPYGSTPIAASLSDLDFYFKNHPDMTGDTAAACRGRFGVLITDGKPDSDYRQFGCDMPGFSCPYMTPEDEAGVLVCGAADPLCTSGSNNGVLKELFVIGLDVTDPATQADLNGIAMRGGTTPIFASDAASIQSALAAIIDSSSPRPISRTTPLSVRTANGNNYRFSAGFELRGGESWRGVLERERIQCGESSSLELTIDDRFDDKLDAQGQRVLFSALPSNTGSPNATMRKGSAVGDNCPDDATGCPLVTFGTGSCGTATCGPGAIDYTHTGLADATEFGVLENWVRGEAGSGREAARLGGIYHSSPVFQAAPTFNLSDSSFNAMAVDSLSGSTRRKEVIYTGTTDGILHAFQVEGPTPDGPGNGDELWGFIPPLLLDKLDAARNSPQIMLDGTPVVKEVFMERTPGADANGNEYRTVLVSGMRGGGRGYFALNVTDPEDPKFLWQVAEPDMGFTYGRPAITQVRITGFEGNPAAQERAAAILPGGTGVGLPGPCASARDGGVPYSTWLDANGTPGGPTHRAQHRCWRGVGAHGRVLRVVDMKTGRTIRTFPDSLAVVPEQANPSLPGYLFPSPLVGSPAVYNGAEGAIGTRAFISDADGVIWRIDMTHENPLRWRAIPFHDMFWELAPDEGQPSPEPPVISVDPSGRVVVIYASGDLDNFENPTAQNRVVSLTEVAVDPANQTPEMIKAGINWQWVPPVSAVVTGPLVLLEGQVFFATYRPVGIAGANACNEGQGALHAFDYIEGSGVPNVGLAAPTEQPLELNVGGVFNYNSPLHDLNLLTGKLIMGLSLAQKPVCQDTSTLTSVLPGGWAGSPSSVAAAPPTFEVVANTMSGVSQPPGASIGQIRQTVLFNPRSRMVSWAGAD